MALCFSCGEQLDSVDKPGRADTCAVCDADVHCCKNCEFYEPGSYNECRESQAERVLEKDRSNFCDYFAFNETSELHSANSSSVSSKDSAHSTACW